jgi:hypothetical protein
MRKSFRKSVGKRTSLGRYRKSRFRRDYAMFLAPLGLAILASAAVTQNTDVLAAAWRDPAAMLEDRSPGYRDPGALYSTKPDYVLTQLRPAERVLPMVRERFAPEELPMIDDFAPDEPPLMAFAPMPGEWIAPPPPPQFAGLTPISSTIRPGVSNPVPEPSTWVIMIVGLFAVAGAMRRRNRQMLDAAHPAEA